MSFLVLTRRYQYLSKMISEVKKLELSTYVKWVKVGRCNFTNLYSAFRSKDL